MYNYTITIDTTEQEKELISQYLWQSWAMKPTIRKQGNKVQITCHGYSFDEKAKNKRMIENAIHDFRLMIFRINL